MKIQLFVTISAALMASAGASPEEKSPTYEKKEDLVPGRRQPEPEMRRFKECGESYTLSPGSCVTITSPNFPGMYPKEMSCRWSITAMSPATKITSCCRRFHLRSSKKCKRDRLVFDEGEMKMRFCGRRKGGLVWESMSGHLGMFFKSYRRRRPGFQCTVCAAGPMPVSETSCVCGQRNGIEVPMRIVDGQQTEPHEYPWQVGVAKPYKMRPYCGGSIISHFWVITSAHCAVQESDVVLVGAHNWCRCQPTPWRIPVKQVVQHPDYSSVTYNNDLSLLEVAWEIPFPYDNTIAPVCLPTFPGDWRSAIVTGWGLQRPKGKQPCNLRDAEIETMDNFVCEEFWPEQITENMICAGTGWEGTCWRDDGGPLIVTNSTDMGPYMQVGITSWGSEECDMPQVYTRVDNYLPWILGYIGETPCPMLPQY